MILADHLCESDGYYTPPVSRLARTLEISGSAVPDVIRSAGEFIAHTGTDSDRYVDVIGVGISPAPWVALLSDDDARLGRLLRRTFFRGLPDRGDAQCERVRVFRAVGEILARADECPDNGRACKPPEDALIICRTEDRAKIEPICSPELLVEFPCESLVPTAMDMLESLRPFFGEGWCQAINDFKSSLEGVRKRRKKFSGIVLSPAPDHAGSRAATARMEMTAMGWNPGGGSDECELRWGSGIWVFRNLKLVNFWDGRLDFRNRRRLRLAAAQSFESTHATDRVLLGFKRLRYAAGDSCGSDDDRWYLFPFLPHRALQALARILPDLRLTLIGYQGGHSRTCEAGVLEALLRRQVEEQGSDWGGVMGSQIDRLLEGRPLDLPAESPLDICDRLDGAEAAGVIPVKSNEDGGLFTVLWRMIAKAGRSEDIIDLHQLSREILGVPATVSKHLARVMPKAGPVEAHAAHRFTDRAVNKLYGESSTAKRNRQRYPLVKLVQQFLHLIGAAFAGRLMVPTFLSEWAAKRFRFVALIPMDSALPRPSRCGSGAVRRVIVGDWKSWEEYSRLFTCEAGEGRVP